MKASLPAGAGWYGVALSILVFGMCGCRTVPEGQEGADGVPPIIREFMDQLMDTRDHIVTISALLDQVEPTTGMAPPGLRDALLSEIQITDERVQSLRALGQQISLEGQDYFARWEAQLRLVRNPAMMARADIRREQVLEAGRQIQEAMEPVRDIAGPYMENLNLYEAYLQGRPVPGAPGADQLVGDLKRDSALLTRGVETMLSRTTELLRTIFPGV
jgi:hypothetical protein